MGTTVTCHLPQSPRRISSCLTSPWAPASLMPGPSASHPEPSCLFSRLLPSWIPAPSKENTAPGASQGPQPSLSHPGEQHSLMAGDSAGRAPAGRAPACSAPPLPSPQPFPYLCRYLNDSLLYCSSSRGNRQALTLFGTYSITLQPCFSTETSEFAPYNWEWGWVLSKLSLAVV